MFQNNIPNMNYNQMNPFLNYNQMNPMMMDNQMLMYQMNMNNMLIQNQINNICNKSESEMLIFDCIFEYDKVLSHLTDPKKTIKFKDIKNNKKISKKFPIYFTKNELYSYINKVNEENTILFYDNNILNNDNSSINDIQDNSTILLFHPPFLSNYRDSSLYKYIENLFPSNIKYNEISIWFKR